MKINVEVTPELVEQMAKAIDEADTAFAVINISSEGLTPQSRGALKRAWHEIQSAIMAMKGPDSPYAKVVMENRQEGTAP